VAPVYYVTQLLIQMHCLNADRGVIVACVGGQSRLECYYARNDAWVVDKAIPALQAFWSEVLAARAAKEIGL
jgi:hypothetical protein